MTFETDMLDAIHLKMDDAYTVFTTRTSPAVHCHFVGRINAYRKLIEDIKDHKQGGGTVDLSNMLTLVTTVADANPIIGTAGEVYISDPTYIAGVAAAMADATDTANGI